MVARAADMSGSGSWSFARFVDRWIFVFMAGLFVATALIGFGPTSIARVAAAQSGARPIPSVLHVHAVLMGAWLLLRLAQTWLMATGRPALHQKLGFASIALVPAMVVAGAILAPTLYAELWGVWQSLPPGPDQSALGETVDLIGNVLLHQIRVGLTFPLLVAWALLSRKSDPATHKRLMILATVLPLSAAVDRIDWLPTARPDSPFADHFFNILLVMPMFAWDVFRQRVIPRAYLIWAGLTLPLMAVAEVLWGSSWWLAIAPRILGMQPW